jgi:glycosyltransferase involved in cell wall biosynthesis
VLTSNYRGLKPKEKRGGLFIRRFAFTSSHKVLSSIYYLAASVVWLFLHRRRYRLLHCYQLSSSLNIGVVNKLLTGRPLIAKLSTTGKMGDASEISRLPFYGIRRFFLGFADRFVVLNDAMRNDLSAVLKKDNHRITFIPNGVKLQEPGAFDRQTRESFRKKLGLTHKFIATYVGRLTEGKGLNDLMLCWKKITVDHPDAHLFLLGAGGMYKNIEEQLKALSRNMALQDYVHFCGEVPNVTDYLLASDIFVLPSISEGMSNSLLEAMSCGNIIISTKISANSGLLDNSNSIMIPPGDSEELYGAISGVIKNPMAYYVLGREAKKRAASYSIERVAGRYLAIYRELL